jgi:lysophospholipase L1-like esterase
MPKRTFIASLFIMFSTCLFAEQAEAPFALHNGDRVVFFGDSITAQRFYTTYVQTAVRARFPDWDIHFYNAGVGGDNVFGGIAGKIDVRLDRDVLKFQPTVVTIMLGMNDRSHATTYEAGYEHILQHLRERYPGLRITILGPTPVDGTTNKNPAANTELRHFVEIDRRLAKKYDATFIDLQTPVLAVMERAETANHLAAMSLIPDRIHPQPPIHMLMAETILKGWNYQATASDVTIEAKTGRVTQQEGVSVSDVSNAEDSLKWTALESADEIRFLTTDGNEVLYQAFVGRRHVGAKVLRVTSLQRGQYSLLIDGRPLPQRWSDEELATGIQLDMLDTPAHRAGVAVYYACSDSELNQTEHSRLIGTLEAVSGEATAKGEILFQVAMEQSDKKIASATKRQEHHFELQKLKLHE